MRIKDIRRFLADRGIEGTLVDPLLYPEHIHVDVMSLFHSLFATTEQVFKKAEFLKALKDSVPNQAKDDEKGELLPIAACPKLYENLARILAARLEKQFSKSRTTIHFDGQPTQQKSKAHDERKARRDGEKERVRAMVLNINSTIESHTDGTRSWKSARRRALKMFKKIDVAWARSQTVALQTIEHVADFIGSQGWTVCRCRHEADVCIGRDPDSVVASSDTDFLFYPGLKVLLQEPKARTSFKLVSMDAVTIKKLGLGMFEKWQVLGVVSENDYTKNLRGESVDLNFKEIKNISISKRDKLMESKLLARKILQKYSATMAPRHREFTADASGMTNNKNIVARSEVAILEHFEPSASIFIDQVETPVEDNPRNPPESIDRCIYSAMKAFARFLDKRPLSLPTTEPSSKSILSSDVGAINAPSSSSSNTHKVSSFSGTTRCFRRSGRVFKWRRYTPPEFHGPTVGTVMEVNKLATSTKSKGKKRSISDSGLDNPNKRFKHQSGVRAKKKKVQSGNDSVPSVDSSSRSSRQAAGKESKPKFNKTIRVSASREARKALGMDEKEQHSLLVGALGTLQQQTPAGTDQTEDVDLQQPFQSVSGDDQGGTYLGDLSMATALNDMNVNDPGLDCALDDFLDPNLVDEAFASTEGDKGRGTAMTKTRTKNVGNICLEAVTDKFKPVTMTISLLLQTTT